MNKLRMWFTKLWTVLRSSVYRFPETLMISMAFVVVMIINNHLDWDARLYLEKTALVLALGIPVSVVLKLVLERFESPLRYRIPGDALLIAAGIAFRLLMPESLHSRFMFRYWSATVIAYVLFSVIPYLWKRRDYGLYCIKVIISFLVTYLYTLVLFLGVIAIIFAVDFLFELNIGEEIYFDTFIAAVGLFGLTYFLGRIPAIREDISDYKYPLVLRILLVSIVAPLISVYTLVLYAYLVRVLVSIGWSGSFVTRLVIWYGFVSIFLLILLSPLKDKSPFVALFSKFYPWAMTVPIVMLLISMVIRINAYGLTASRAVVMLSGLWFTLSVLYLVIVKTPTHQVLTLSLVIVFTLGMFGPVNAISLSDSSQIKRLDTYLENMGILSGNQVSPKAEVREADKIVVSDILEYLVAMDSLDKVPYLPEDFEMKDTQAVLGFQYMSDRYYQDDYGHIFISYYLSREVLIPIEGYDYHTAIEERYESQEDSQEGDVVIDGSDGRLSVRIEGVLVFDENIKDLLMASEISLQYNMGDEPIILEYNRDFGRLKLLFNEINGQMNGDVFELDYYRAQVFLDLKEE